MEKTLLTLYSPVLSGICMCFFRPLPPDEMKNIIFNVFGEDMSTGVVTQVRLGKGCNDNFLEAVEEAAAKIFRIAGRNRTNELQADALTFELQELLR